MLGDLRYADAIGSNASKERKMPDAIGQVLQSCEYYDLKFSTDGSVHVPTSTWKALQ